MALSAGVAVLAVALPLTTGSLAMPRTDPATRAATPTLVPTIVFRGNLDVPSLEAMESDGSRVRGIVKDPSLSTASVSPDGQTIVYAANHDRLWLADASGSEPPRLVPNATGHDPAFARDLIAYIAPDGLAVIRPDGSGRRVVYPNPGTSLLDPTISADGSRIAFIISYSYDDTLPAAGIYAINGDGTGLRTLVGSRHAGEPDLSADGTRLAFTVFDFDDPGNDGLYTVGYDGSDRREVLPGTGSASEPVFSPDGSQIAFQVASRTDVVNSDGSGRHEIRDGGANPFDWVAMAREPRMGRTMIVERTSAGVTLVKEPGEKGCRTLEGPELLAIGSRIDAHRAEVRITAANRGGGLTKKEVEGALVKVKQKKGKLSITEQEGRLKGCTKRTQT